MKRAMLALGLLALAIGLAIVLSGGSSGKKRHARGAAITAGRSSDGGGSSAGGDGGSSTSSQAATPSRISIAARYLGLTTAQLHSRLKQGRSLAQLADATKGRSARGLIDAIAAAQAARLESLKLSATVERARLARYRQRIERIVAHVKATPGIERDLLAASTYLGVPNARLHTLLQQGQTLAQVVRSTSGRSIGGLRQAIVKSRRSRLKAAAASGLITARDERAALAALPGLVESELRRKLLQGSANGR